MNKIAPFVVRPMDEQAVIDALKAENRKLKLEHKELLNGLQDLLEFYSRPDQCQPNIKSARAAVKVKRAARVALASAEKGGGQ